MTPDQVLQLIGVEDAAGRCIGHDLADHAAGDAAQTLLKNWAAYATTGEPLPPVVREDVGDVVAVLFRWKDAVLARLAQPPEPEGQEATPRERLLAKALHHACVDLIKFAGNPGDLPGDVADSYLFQAEEASASPDGGG